MFSRLYNYDIDCKLELVRLSPSERYVRDNAARALFIYCEEEKLEAVSNGLKAIYNKRRPAHHPGTDYPDGRAMKFVPGNFGLPTSIGPTQEQRKDFNRKKGIQIDTNEVFRSNVVRINGLLEADVAISIQNPAAHGTKSASIRQLLMVIKSREDYKTPIISGVDLIKKTNEEPYYVTTFFPGFREEVETIFNHLPVYLAAYYGRKIWDCFSALHKSQMKEFFFDRETNTVVTGGRNKTEREDDLCADESYANMFGVSCSLDFNEDNNNKPVMYFDLTRQFNLDLLPDNTNILADEEGSTGTALTGVSAVT